ncbi:MAG: hypothetical protein ACFBSE_14045 [Prochloraceae cyanobacterium]
MQLKIGQVSLFSALFLGLSVVPGKIVLAETLTRGQSYQIAYEYPKNFVETYTRDCIEQATDHLEIEDARKICKCTLDKFQDNYTYDRYKELSAESKQDIGLTCFEEMEPEEE